MKTLILVLLIAIASATPAQAATVISCNDGDTCKFNDRGKTVSVRIAGIDAPE